MFTPFRLRDLVIPNRVVVSPMCQYVAAEGTVGDWHLVHLGSRAIGGAGLVMAEMTDVCPDGRISPWCAGLYAPEHTAAWKRVVDFVHRESPAKIGIQLGHAGRKGATRRLWEGDSEPLPEGGWPLLSASPLPYFPDRSPVPREMTLDDMRQVAAEFVTATRLAERGRLRPARDPHGAWLPARVVHLAVDQYADRRVRRIAREPDALSAGGVRRLPCAPGRRTSR